MGNLVDTFILIPKDIDVCTCIDACSENIIEHKKSIVNLVRDKYKNMLSDLIDIFLEENETVSIRDIINPIGEDYDIIDRIENNLDKYNCDYDDRFRGDCLRQELRRVFYDTLCIIENDYSSIKTNKFIILGTGSIITESEWDKSRQ